MNGTASAGAPATGPRSPDPVTAGDPLADEQALLAEARRRLAEDPAAALARLDTHAARYPAGQLAAERELLALEALDRLDRSAERRARAQRFLDRFPSSPFQAVVRRIAEGE